MGSQIQSSLMRGLQNSASFNSSKTNAPTAAAGSTSSRNGPPPSALNDSKSTVAIFLLKQVQSMRATARSAVPSDAPISNSNVTQEDFAETGHILYHAENLLEEVRAQMEQPSAPGAHGEQSKTRQLQALDQVSQAVEKMLTKLGMDDVAYSSKQTPGADGGKITGNPDNAVLEKCQKLVDLLPRLCEGLQWASNPQESLTIKSERKALAPEEIDRMVFHAALAETVTRHDLQDNLARAEPYFTKIRPDAQTMSQIPLALMEALKAKLPNLKFLPDMRFIEAGTGLIFALTRDDKNLEWHIAYGQTTDGEHKGDLLKRTVTNASETFSQLVAVAHALAGPIGTDRIVPHSFESAAIVADVVKQHFPEADGWKGFVTGHSKGAAEAEYVAMKNKLPATCFAAFELGEPLLSTIKEDEKDFGKHNIVHRGVDGDPIHETTKALRHVPILNKKNITHVGTTHVMKPHPGVKGRSILKQNDCHQSFFDSALYQAEQQRKPE
ncbi:MAG: hypothetical protein V4754_13860 [Pseudomonadota bacterium]